MWAVLYACCCVMCLFNKLIVLYVSHHMYTHPRLSLSLSPGILVGVKFNLIKEYAVFTKILRNILCKRSIYQFTSSHFINVMPKNIRKVVLSEKLTNIERPNQPCRARRGNRLNSTYDYGVYVTIFFQFTILFQLFQLL